MISAVYPKSKSYKTSHCFALTIIILRQRVCASGVHRTSAIAGSADAVVPPLYPTLPSTVEQPRYVP